MKRVFSVLLTLTMIISFIPAFAVMSNAEASVTNLIDPEVLTQRVGGATWTFNEDGTLTGAGGGDNAIFSDVKVPADKHVFIEATAKIDDNQAWGIIFSGNTSNTFDGNLWYCYNIDKNVPNSRLFKVNPFQEFFDWRSEGFRDGQYHTLGMEFTGDGFVKFYYDHELKYNLPVADEMEEMNIGAMVCNSTTTFESFTVEYDRTDAEYERKFALKTTDLLADGVLDYKAGDGSYSIENGVLTAPNRDKGDTFFTSGVRVEKGQHVYIEATGKMEAKDRDSAWGILLVAEKENPGASWICYNVDGTSNHSRMFMVGNGAVGALAIDNYPFVIDRANLTCEKDITLGLEITEDGTVYAVCNGAVTGTGVINNWNGAYVGLMTWFSSTTLTSAKVYEIGEFEASVNQDDQTIDAGDTVTITANAPIDGVTVDNTALEAGEDYTVEGNTVTIGAAVTSGLAGGEHTVVVTSGNGNATLGIVVNAADPTETGDPEETGEPVNTKTGDIAAIVVATVAMISLAGVALAASKRKIEK